MYYKLNLKVLNLAMIKKGYSINELAKESGVGKATISRILSKKSIATPKTIYKLVKALEIDVEEILLEVEE